MKVVESQDSVLWTVLQHLIWRCWLWSCPSEPTNMNTPIPFAKANENSLLQHERSRKVCSALCSPVHNLHHFNLPVSTLMLDLEQSLSSPSAHIWSLPCCSAFVTMKMRKKTKKMQLRTSRRFCCGDKRQQTLVLWISVNKPGSEIVWILDDTFWCGGLMMTPVLTWPNPNSTQNGELRY